MEGKSKISDNTLEMQKKYVDSHYKMRMIGCFSFRKPSRFISHVCQIKVWEKPWNRKNALSGEVSGGKSSNFETKWMESGEIEEKTRKRMRERWRTYLLQVVPRFEAALDFASLIARFAKSASASFFPSFTWKNLLHENVNAIPVWKGDGINFWFLSDPAIF